MYPKSHKDACWEKDETILMFHTVPLKGAPLTLYLSNAPSFLPLFLVQVNLMSVPQASCCLEGPQRKPVRWNNRSAHVRWPKSMCAEWKENSQGESVSLSLSLCIYMPLNKILQWKILPFLHRLEVQLEPIEISEFTFTSIMIILFPVCYYYKNVTDHIPYEFY